MARLPARTIKNGIALNEGNGFPFGRLTERNGTFRCSLDVFGVIEVLQIFLLEEGGEPKMLANIAQEITQFFIGFGTCNTDIYAPRQ